MSAVRGTGGGPKFVKLYSGGDTLEENKFGHGAPSQNLSGLGKVEGRLILLSTEVFG